MPDVMELVSKDFEGSVSTLDFPPPSHPVTRGDTSNFHPFTTLFLTQPCHFKCQYQIQYQISLDFIRLRFGHMFEQNH